MFEPPGPCPVCGEEVPARAKACPHCGACDRAGWEEEATAVDGLDLPHSDEPFDYEGFVAREFEGREPRRRLGWLWAVVAVLLVGLLLWWSGWVPVGW